MGVEVKNCCEAALRDAAFRFGCEVYVLQVGVDHVSLFVGLYPSCSISVLVGSLKCNCARQLFLAFPEFKSKLWKGYLWSRGKFYRSIGQVNAETIKHYIEQSKHQ